MGNEWAVWTQHVANFELLNLQENELWKSERWNEGLAIPEQ